MGEPFYRKPLSKALENLLGPSSQELGGMLGDQIRLYRWKAAQSILERAKEWAGKRGIEYSNVPIRFLVPFLERCSLEDEESEMCERWSKLLCNAVLQYQQKYEIYSRILSEITPDEARLLKEMWQTISEIQFLHFDNYSSLFNSMPNNIDFGDLDRSEKSVDEMSFNQSGGISFVFRGNEIPNTNEFILTNFDEGAMLQHLESLRLVRNESTAFVAKGERCFVFQSQLTPLGYDFVSACESTGEE